MNRRTFLAAPALTMVAGSGCAAPSARPAVFELRYVWMRNGPQISRTLGFYEKGYLPAARRAGAGAMGFFQGLIAENSPFLLAVTSFPSLAAMETAAAKMQDDREFQGAFGEYNSMTELSYDGMETSLLRAFSSMPAIEAPPAREGKGSRIFELRTYQANNVKASKRKIKMFDDDEIRIFRKCDMLPVFFGETIAGKQMPNLTYMLAFDNLEHRQKAWAAFGADPEWQKLRAQPGLSDAEIVSSISNAILRPTAFSPIR